MSAKRIVIIGGGTGTYTLLKGLKKYPHHLSVIVSMTDSGGSNRVIRDEFGLLPTSDIRQCIVALASPKSNGVLRELFTYRYSQGTGITGMSFGNLFMAALTDIYGSQEKAIEQTCKVLAVQGEIIPVTYDDVHLVATYANGKQILGERFIDEPKEIYGKHRIKDLRVFPDAKANKKAIAAITKADLVIFGPGDLYTSIICNIVVDGIAEAIKNSHAKKVYVMNLMTKFGQTHRFSARDHIDELEKYLGQGSIDVCLVNHTRKYSNQLLVRYKGEKSEPVKDDLNGDSIKVVRKDFVSSDIYKIHKADVLRRSLIRHDSDKLAKAVVGLLE